MFKSFQNTINNPNASPSQIEEAQRWINDPINIEKSKNLFNKQEQEYANIAVMFKQKNQYIADRDELANKLVVAEAELVKLLSV
jgi:hypothetical protein